MRYDVESWRSHHCFFNEIVTNRIQKGFFLWHVLKRLLCLVIGSHEQLLSQWNNGNREPISFVLSFCLGLFSFVLLTFYLCPFVLVNS